MGPFDTEVSVVLAAVRLTVFGSHVFGVGVGLGAESAPTGCLGVAANGRKEGIAGVDSGNFDSLVDCGVHLEHVQTAAISAYLPLVAGAVLCAFRRVCRDGASVDGVTAITLLGVLDAKVLVAVAESLAALSSHVGGAVVRIAGQSSAVAALSVASQGCIGCVTRPRYGLASFDSRARRRVASGTGDLRRSNHVSVAGRGDAAGKFVESALDLLAWEDWASLGADLRGIGVVGCCKDWAILDHTIFVLDKTLVNSLGERSRVPAVNEVAMEAKAGLITIGENKLAIATHKIGDGVEDFIEQMREQHGVGRWADTVVNPSEMCHVRLVW